MMSLKRNKRKQTLQHHPGVLPEELKKTKKSDGQKKMMMIRTD
jgi:hypothetical protein